MSTIDPEVDGQIERARQAAEKQPDRDADQVIDEEEEEIEERNFMDPSRWWVASTLCPLIASTIGPMASAFNICALVQDWRFYVPPGVQEGLGTPIQDPKWLIAINGVSLACALIANFALLLNMARRVSFAIAQPITVIGFFLAAFLLIGLLGVASSPAFQLQPQSSHALSQAFYYAIIAAALYTIIAIMMSVTVYGAYAGHYSKEFQLTISQRTLMLQTISFMFYLLLGALIFSTIEGWEFVDAVYWADFTLLTIGIGDFYVPKTHLGRSLLFPFSVGGIVTLGLVISSVRSMVLDSGGAKLAARITEKKREAVLATANLEKGKYKISTFATRHFNPSHELEETSKRQQEFYAMRQILQRAERKHRYTSLAISVGVTCLLWFGGAAVFQQCETDQEWSYFDSLYFAFTSLLTIGYGDFTAQSNSGRPFFVVWSLLAVPSLTVLISDLGDTLVKGIAEATEWVASFTILPGEGGIRATLKKEAKRFTGGRVFSPENFETKQPGNFLPSRGKKRHKLHYGDVGDVLLDRLNEQDIAKAIEAGGNQPAEEKDRQFYTFLLLKEVRKILVDLDKSPPKRYTYDEWTYYLKLLGQDENDPSKHTRPSVKPAYHEGSYKTYIDLAKHIDRGDDCPEWSWMGAMSPLMSDKSEAEWILHRLLVRLQKELHLASYQDPKREPPISVTAAQERLDRGSQSAPQSNASERKKSD